MDRESHEKLMADAKYKPGDIVWTNVKTYCPWPGKVLRVPHEILKIYPDETRIMHYVELYMKKDRDFHLEDDLWPFDDGQGIFSVKKRSVLFHQAVHAAEEEARTGLPEDIAMDVENSASFCRTQFLRNYPSSAATRENMQINSEVDFAPTKGLFKSDLIPETFQNKDLNSQDMYEFPEFDPLAFTAYTKNIPLLDQASESSLNVESSAVFNNPSKRKMPLLEKVLEPKMSPKLHSSNKNIGRVIPKGESKLEDEPVPIDSIVKVPKVEKVSVRRSGRRSRRRWFMKKLNSGTSNCDQTVPEIDLTGDDTKFEKETDVKDVKVPVEQKTPKAALGKEPDSKAQGLSSHMLLQPRMHYPELPQRTSVGFLGLGGLGKKIVRKLLADGHQVTVWNRTLYKTYEMLDIGAHSKSTAEQVVNSCDVTFCCVSDTTAVKEVFYSSNGVLSGLREGKSFVLLTTIEPKVSTDIEKAVKDKGCLYLEVPMFPAGGRIIDNSLLAVAAGSQSVLRNCVPYFRSFVKDFFFVGHVPDANVMVLIMKSLSAVKIAALAETMALAEKNDVPTDILFQIIKQTQLASPFLLSKAKAMLESGPSEDADIFPLAHFSNDLTSTLNLSNDLRTPLVAAAKQVYLHSKLRGYSDHDVSAVYLKYTER